MAKKVKQDIELSDIGDAISDLATQMDTRFNQVDQRLTGHDNKFKSIDQRFDQVDARFDQVDARFDQVDTELYAIRKDQRETREWLERIDSRILGIESDIKEIYNRIVALEKKIPTLTPSEIRELIHRVDQITNWAKKVSRKTGIALPKL